MKTFDDEYKELILWLKTEHEKLDSDPEVDREVKGFDGSEYCARSRVIGDEYRRRLKALRAKYNITAKDDNSTSNQNRSTFPWDTFWNNKRTV